MSFVQGDLLKHCIMYAHGQERIVWPLTHALAGKEKIHHHAWSQAGIFVCGLTGKGKIDHGKGDASFPSASSVDAV